jgi:hypothetical protein
MHANGTPAQRLTFYQDGTLRVLGRCLNDLNFGGSGSKIILSACNGGTNESGTLP